MDKSAVQPDAFVEASIVLANMYRPAHVILGHKSLPQHLLEVALSAPVLAFATVQTANIWPRV